MPKIIPISGEIGWDVWPNAIREQLIEAAGEDVEFHISSPGGYVYDGLEIFNLIKNYEGKTTARIVGMAASMASYIPLAADKVVAESNAIYMIHNARAFTGGDQNEHIKVANILKGMSNLLAQEYIKQTGKDKKEIAKMMDAETYLFGNEIKEAGFVDEIIEVAETPADQEAKDDLTLSAMLKVENCINHLKEQPEFPKNFGKIAAVIDDSTRKPVKSPVNSNKPNEENMTFEEFCAKFPEEAKRITAWLEAEEKEKYGAMALGNILDISAIAKVEHEKAVADARTEVEAGKLTKEQVNFVAKVIESENYDGSLKSAGVKVFTGERDFQNFEDLVAQEDRFNEKLKSIQVKKDQPSVTKGEQHDPTNVDVNKIKAEAKAHGEKIGTVKKEA